MRWILRTTKNDYFFSACCLDTLCISHTPISLAAKTVKAHVCSVINPTALPRKLKIAPTTLPTIAGNTLTVFPASLLSASANLFNHFFKTPSSFGGEPPAPPPPPKTPVIASAMVEIVIKRAVSIEKIVTPCSRNKVRIFSAKDLFLSRTFSSLFDPCDLCLKVFSILW